MKNNILTKKEISNILNQEIASNNPNMGEITFNYYKDKNKKGCRVKLAQVYPIGGTVLIEDFDSQQVVDVLNNINDGGWILRTNTGGGRMHGALEICKQYIIEN